MELISRAAAKEAIRKKFKSISDRCEINGVINDLPAVEAVPVVRCDKCMYRGDNKVCIMLVGKTQDDFYCKYGECLDGDT